MARLYGRLQGERGQVTRTGHREITGTVETWSYVIRSSVIVGSDGVERARVAIEGKHGGTVAVLFDGELTDNGIDAGMLAAAAMTGGIR